MFIESCTCGKTIECKEDYSVGDFMKRTGWGVAPTLEGKLPKLCPECYARAKKLAQELADIVGSKYVSVSNLLPREPK